MHRKMGTFAQLVTTWVGLGEKDQVWLADNLSGSFSWLTVYCLILKSRDKINNISLFNIVIYRIAIEANDGLEMKLKFFKWSLNTILVGVILEYFHYVWP